MQFDAVVVGAGSTGSAAAWMLSNAGLRVALVESRALGSAGARHVNDVPPWLFDEAQVARPAGAEKRCDHETFHFLDRTGAAHLGMQRPMWGVDAALLVRRMQTGALRSGVAVFERAADLELVHRAGRPEALNLRADHGGGERSEIELRARLFVDASGLAGVLRGQSEALASTCPPPRGEQLTSAIQVVCEVTDRAAARDYLSRNGFAEGDVVVWSGSYSGFETRMARLERGLSEVELLVGVAHDGGKMPARRVLAELRAHLPWAGRVRSGGGGDIPCRRPYDLLVAPGLALIGDAACQVFPAHGSGMGAGLLAARLLSNAVKGQGDPGELAALWDYQWRHHRGRGAVHAGYEVFRRAVLDWGPDGVEAMLKGGLILPGTTHAALAQRPPSLGLGEGLSLTRALWKAPAGAGQMAAMAGRMTATTALWRAFPRLPNMAAVRRWARMAQVVSGSPADVNLV